MQMRKIRRKRVAVTSVVVALTAAGSAAAFQQLPAGQQVNNDAAAGINPALPVNIEDPANSDVVGGSLVATKPDVPWSIFRQTESPGKDQVFSRSFANGVWTTRGNGTANGRSSASPSPALSGSLNFDQGQDGEAPSIDFAGAGRTVPWASWYEHTTGTNFGADNIFASKFDNTGDANQGKWIFAGQGRGTGGGTVQVPSLNIHTNRDAVNPVVQGGTAAAGNDPSPWVTWQELDGGSPGPNQIFTSKGVKPTSGTTCPNDPPASVNPIKPAPAVGQGAIGGFCFQQVGIDRLDPGTGESPTTISDPSMNVDPSRDGVEPDMAFTGTNDTVPWVVWYEQNPSGVGLRGNELVFAAKATTNAAADGQFQWTAVGINGTGLLDANLTDTTPTGGKHFGACATSQTAEGNCSVNANPGADAEDPRVAAGTMSATLGAPTVPWIVWDEGSATTPNNNSVFVARLVGSGAAARFVIANGGQPVGTGDRADITFSGHTPYVTWHHNNQVVTGHFTTPDSFVKDLPPIGTEATDAVRAPISSGCAATPFNQDGNACQASVIGTPFFLFTDGDASHAKLFADAYQASPTTGAASNVTTSSATINGNVATKGALVDVSFQFGTTTAYGGTTPAQRTGTDSPSAFSAALTGLPANTVIHYRVIARSDFGPTVGSDQTFKTISNPPPPPTPKPGHASFGRVTVSGTTASVRASCSGNSVDSCRLSFKLTVTETLIGKKIIAVGARAKRHKVTVTVGTASTRLNAGQSRVVKISLNGAGKRLLSKYRTLRTTLRVTQSGKRGSVLTKTVTFKAPKKHRH
jgi:hypothetical protein